jgi:hypothetical protein
MNLQAYHSSNELSPHYTFLEDEPFHLLFDMCVSGTNNTWSIHLCIVDVNTQCKIVAYSNSSVSEETQLPFIRYVLQHTLSNTEEPGAGILRFPTFSFECVNNTEENDQQIRNQALTHILQTFGWSPRPGSSPEEAAKAFRGFIPMKSEGCVMMVYDYRILRQHYQPMAEVSQNVPRRLWGIVDEVVFERAVLGVPIAPEICDTVRDTPLLWNIQYKGRDMDFPFSLLSVRYSYIDDEEWSNEKVSPYVEDRMMKQQSLVKIGSATDSYTYGGDYGDLYLFSAKPLYDTAPGDLLTYQRYAVFTVGAKYQLDEKQHSAIFAVREQLGGNDIGNDIAELFGDADVDMGLDADADADADTKANETIVPCLYFVETQLRHPMPLWGIREISRFAVL